MERVPQVVDIDAPGRRRQEIGPEPLTLLGGGDVLRQLVFSGVERSAILSRKRTAYGE